MRRVLDLFMQSFKYLYREKLSFFIASFTVALCLIIISFVSSLGYYSVKKILSMDLHKITVTFDKNIEKSCENFCDAEKGKLGLDKCPVCPIYNSSALNVLNDDSPSEKEGKIKCAKCIEEEYNQDDNFDNKLIDGRKMYKFRCDEACAAPEDSKKYSAYYGSKIGNSCMRCMDDNCDSAVDLILKDNSDYIELVSPPIYKSVVLKKFERLTGKSYFNSYRGVDVMLPMGAEFILTDKVDNGKKLNKLIANIQETKNENGQYIIKSVDVFDKDKFDYYKDLIPLIIGLVLLVVVFTLLIPFFIVSNTIRLIIHSKRQVLFTLRLLGERDLFIKMPFIFQGIWQGFVGCLLFFLCMFVLDLVEFNIAICNFINKTFNSLVDIQFNFMSQPLELFLLLGVAMGLFGSMRSCSKYLR
tara:strand:- start:1848 stop:3089 length:1242 start_codon:yes stop_codon:yes gene_type:complete